MDTALQAIDFIGVRNTGSTPAASTKNRKGSPLGGPFLFLAAVTAEPAPDGKGGRSAAEVCRAIAKTQTPAASTKLKSRGVQLHLYSPVLIFKFGCSRGTRQFNT